MNPDLDKVIKESNRVQVAGMYVTATYTQLIRSFDEKQINAAQAADITSALLGYYRAVFLSHVLSEMMKTCSADMFGKGAIVIAGLALDAEEKSSKFFAQLDNLTTMMETKPNAQS